MTSKDLGLSPVIWPRDATGRRIRLKPEVLRARIPPRLLNMAEIRLFTSSSREREGRVDVTAHLEPEGDGTKEKVITQTRVDGFILPPGTYMKISASRV